MAELFHRGGLNPSPETLRRFWTFHQLLRARNEELDLTRLHSFESMVLKHYVDSALVADLVDLPSPLLDLGTGAGFPGLPLKIVRPDLSLILAEGRARRLAFLDEACQTLNLTDVELYPHQVTATFDRPVQGLITRDLEAIERTLDRAVGFLDQGGRAIFMKGPAVDAEVAAAIEHHGQDFRLVMDRAYTLGQTTHQRRLIVFEKITPIQRVAASRPVGHRIKEISSVQNPDFKVWRGLLEGRGPRKHGLALISGPKQIAEMIRDFPDKIAAVLGLAPDDPCPTAPLDLPRYRLRPELFRELDGFGTGEPLLVVRVPEMAQWDGEFPAGCTLLLPFQDPANVGAVIRSAVALGVARVVLLAEAAHPFHPRSLRAAGPTVYRTTLLRGPAISALVPPPPGLLILGAQGRPLSRVVFPPAFGLVAGLEGPGLPTGWDPAQAMAVPMAPGVDSLNAATATAIALYEWQRQKGLAKQDPPPPAK